MLFKRMILAFMMVTLLWASKAWSKESYKGKVAGQKAKKTKHKKALVRRTRYLMRRAKRMGHLMIQAQKRLKRKKRKLAKALSKYKASQKGSYQRKQRTKRSETSARIEAVRTSQLGYQAEYKNYRKLNQKFKFLVNKALQSLQKVGGANGKAVIAAVKKEMRKKEASPKMVVKLFKRVQLGAN